MENLPRIGIDCRFAATNSGLGRYTREFVKHLLKRGDNIVYVLFVHSTEESWLKQLQKPSTFNLQPATARHYSLAEQVRLPSLIKRASLDLYFAPHFNVPFRCSVPFVVTIHDLILHRYPNQAGAFKRAAYRMLMRNAVTKARSIVAVSKFTAKELSDVYGEKVRSKTTVIYEGVSDSFYPRSTQEQEQIRRKYHIERPFFLYVGNAKEHKNVQMLIDAFSNLSDPNVELILVTSGKEAAALTPTNGVRCIEHLSDEDLPALYTAARAFVSPSLYEGFGLPILEAQACGTPIIAVRSSSVPEVAGPNALLVEPTIEQFTAALRNPPRASGSSQKWSWDEAAAATASLLRRAIAP